MLQRNKNRKPIKLYSKIASRYFAYYIDFVSNAKTFAFGTSLRYSSICLWFKSSKRFFSCILESRPFIYFRLIYIYVMTPVFDPSLLMQIVYCDLNLVVDSMKERSEPSFLFFPYHAFSRHHSLQNLFIRVLYVRMVKY